MPSKFRVRYIFRPLVNIIAKGLSKIGITPNIATILMLISAILSFVSLVFFSHLLIFAIFIFITGILDGVDGAIARLTNKSTKLGGFFDSITGRCLRGGGCGSGYGRAWPPCGSRAPGRGVCCGFWT